MSFFLTYEWRNQYLIFIQTSYKGKLDVTKQKNTNFTNPQIKFSSVKNVPGIAHFDRNIPQQAYLISKRIFF